MAEKEFQASNGLVLRTGSDGSVSLPLSAMRVQGLPSVLGEQGINALREFFQEERDRDLQRWRWPLDTFLVVYPTTKYNVVYVLDERTGFSTKVTMNAGLTFNPAASNGFGAAARAWFDAHPDPKPWHDAQPGEVWLIRFENSESEHAGVVDKDGVLHYGDDGMVIHCTYAGIAAGRRIWPPANLVSNPTSFEEVVS